MDLGRLSSRVVGVDEAAVVVALALLTAGLWPLIGRPALVIPGAVLLWMALPARRPFVVRPDEADKSSRRKD